MVSRLLVRRAMRGASAWPIVVLLASCAVGPDYVRPIADTPSAFKESEGWKPAEPRAIDPHQPWWTWYGDPVLDGLVAQVDGANQTLRQAEAQYRAARAAVDVARAGYWPQVGANASVQRGVSSTQPNAVESFAPFAAVVLAGQVLGVHTAVTATCAAVYFWARLAHAVVHVSGFGQFRARTLIFTIGWLAFVVDAFAVLQRAL